MKRVWLGAGVVLIVVAAGISPFLFRDANTPVLDLKPQSAHEAEAHDEVCPWRDPAGDRKRWFPTATGTQDELLLVGRNRGVIESKLGRRVTPDETVLRLHRIVNGTRTMGTVVTRRVRGESGVIELVLAVDAQNRVVRARVQRLREPDDVAKAIQSPVWLGAWTGKTAESNWTPGDGLPSVPAPAQTSARALADAGRSTLVLLSN